MNIASPTKRKILSPGQRGKTYDTPEPLSPGQRGKTCDTPEPLRPQRRVTIATAKINIAVFAILLLGIFAVCEQKLISISQELELLRKPQGSVQPQESVQPVSSSSFLVPNRCDAKSRGTHFDSIYQRGVWSGTKLLRAQDFYGHAQDPVPDVRKQSASGPGSMIGSNTENSLKIIRDAINKYDIKSMADVPCGDVNWIMDSFETDTLPVYAGFDITRAVIDVNNQRFAHHSNKEFHFWDLTECVLPKFHNRTTGEEHPFDLVHVRDVIQHLSLKQGVQYFCNIFRSGARILITTTYKMPKNNNIYEGGWYQNDLTQDPFSFPKNGDNCVMTHPMHEPDFTCIYDLAQPWVKEFVETKC